MIPSDSGIAGLRILLYLVTDQLTYRGYYYDFETGLYYLQSRYYSPTWGRFINADEHFDTKTGILGTNRYIYCDNNPVMFTDPTGEWAAPAGEDANISNGTYYLGEKVTNKYLDVSSSGKTNGTKVIAYTFGRSANQRWKIKKVDSKKGLYELTPVHAEKEDMRLDVSGGVNADGTKVQIYKSNKSKAQRWKIWKNGDGTVRLVPECSISYSCLKINTNSNNAQIWKNETGGSQMQWTIEPVSNAAVKNGTYFLREKSQGRYLDVSKSGGAGAQVIGSTFNGGKNQQWKVAKIATGGYYLYPQHNTDVRLDVKDVADKDDTPVIVYKHQSNTAQRWRIISNGDGTNRLMPLCAPSRCLDNSNKNTAITYTWKGNNNQRWTFVAEAGRVLNTPQLGQETDMWCWAASALMLARTYVPNTTRTQTNIVQTIKGRLFDQHGNREGGNLDEAARGARFATNNTINFDFNYSTISEDELLAHLNRGDPVYIGRGEYVNNVRAGGHATVIYGYRVEGSNLVYLVRDPWPTKSDPWPARHTGQSYSRTYAKIMQDGNVKWDRVLFRRR